MARSIERRHRAPAARGRRPGMPAAAPGGAQAAAVFEAARPAFRAPSLARQKLLLWLASFAILAVSLLAFLSIQRLVAASERVHDSETTLMQISQYLSDLKDVETGARSYLLSGGDPRHLQRQQLGIAAAATTEQRLRRITIDQPELRRSLEPLFALSAQRIDTARRLVAEQNDPVAIQRILAEGTAQMERIRARVVAILDFQQRHYSSDRRKLERQAWLTSIALAVGVVLCLAAISALFTVRGREVLRRRVLEEELRALNLELEDRVQERTAEVKRARDLLTAVVENLPDMVLLKEPDGDSFRYILINAAGERLLGRDRAQILGRREVDLFPPDEAEAILAMNREAIDAGQPQSHTNRHLTGAGGTRTVETRVVPITAGDRGRPMILAIVRDVSEARAREEQLRQLQRMDAVGQLTGGVAHDFNNLLAIIQGNSELLRNEIADGSDSAEMLDDVMAAAARGAELVKRLLAFSRKQHLDPESVDLNARLDGVLGLLRRALGENIEIRVHPASGLWSAIVDPTQVDDAVVNLAINARDAMPDGGTLSIETANVTLDEDYCAHHAEVTPGDYVMVAISDTGTGMPADVIARVFEPFFTTKPEGKGTGLGLSQVFGWVKQSGGHIKVYSEVGHGTTIKLYLPRAGAAAGDREQVPEPATPNGTETIFVVEDNPKVRKTVLRQLHDLGYRTIEAEDGDAALTLARGGARFDLLLTDVIMPGGVTGYQLARELRGDRPDLKVLLTSGYTEYAAPADEGPRRDMLLSKPYRKHDLGRAVRAALDTEPA